MQAGSRGSLEQMMTQLQTNELTEVAVVVKGDVQGSVEAIEQALAKLGTEEVAARVVHGAVGGITESDVSLAVASECADPRIQRSCQQAGQAKWPSAKASKSATTRSSTIWSMT